MSEVEKTQQKKPKNDAINSILGNGEPKKVRDYSYLDGKRMVFTKDNQPSGLAKSKGWEKRRVKQEIMDMMASLDNLTMEEFEALRKDIEQHPEKHTVREARLLRYMTREKFIKDYLDRNTGKAPQDVDITSNGEGFNKITIEHIHHLPVQDLVQKITTPEETKETEAIEGELIEKD